MNGVIAREMLIAGVLAATDKLVEHAGQGDWQSVNKSVADRKLLLEQLSRQEPQVGEHDFLRALREAAAESETALATMSATPTQLPNGPAVGNRLCTKA